MPDIGKLLWPKSVAVIGASSDTHILRGRVFEIIRSHPFAGAIFPVSRSAAEVQGLKAYPSIDALPEPVDMAVLIVPAEYVPAELERCGRAQLGRCARARCERRSRGRRGTRVKNRRGLDGHCGCLRSVGPR